MASTRRAETPREIPDIETSSAGYASRFAGRHGAYFLRVQRETVLAALPDGSHQSVLEIGGGHGQLAAPLASAGYHVTAFGSSAACRARVGGGSHHNPISFVTGDILHLPLDRKTVVKGRRVSVRVDLGGRRIIEQTITIQ